MDPGPCQVGKKKSKGTDIILIHELWRTGAETFPELSQTGTDVSKATRRGGIRDLSCSCTPMQRARGWPLRR